MDEGNGLTWLRNEVSTGNGLTVDAWVFLVALAAHVNKPARRLGTE